MMYKAPLFLSQTTLYRGICFRVPNRSVCLLYLISPLFGIFSLPCFWFIFSARMAKHSVSAFIDSCENVDSGGGFSKAPGQTPDLLHSFYSLLFKSLAGHPGLHVNK